MNDLVSVFLSQEANVYAKLVVLPRSFSLNGFYPELIKEKSLLKGNYARKGGGNVFWSKYVNTSVLQCKVTPWVVEVYSICRNG